MTREDEIYERAARIWNDGGHSKGYTVPELVEFIKEWEKITGRLK